MGSYYANFSTGNDANPGTIVSPKQNITGASGLISIPHGTADSTQPSILYLARDSVWPRQRLLPTAGKQAAQPLTIMEYGSGTVRPTIDYEHTQIGAYVGVVALGSYTILADLRVVNLGSENAGDHTGIGSRAITATTKQRVSIINCEVEWCSEGAFVLVDCGDVLAVNGCLARLSGMRYLLIGGSYPPPLHCKSSPEISGGTGSCQISDNVLDRGIGEGHSVVQAKNVSINGGISFSIRAAAQYLNCTANCTVQRTINYGTTNTAYHRNAGTVGYGVATLVETESGTPGNDIRSPYQDNVTIKLNMVAFTNRGITIAASNANTRNPYKMNVDQNTLVDNNYNIAMLNNQSATAGSTFWNNASLIYSSSGAAHNEASVDVPTGLSINYTSWVGALSTRLPAMLGANDPGAPFHIFKQTGWRSLSNIDALGAWAIVNRTLSNDAQAENFEPQSEAMTLQALPHPALDWRGFAGLTNPGALRYQPEEPPPVVGGAIRVEHHVVDFGASADTYTLSFNQPGKDAASVWPHLRNTRFATAGYTAGTTSATPVRDLGLTIENIGASSCTLVRHSTSGAADVRVYVEVWFYDGPAGGANEFIVRWSGTKSIAAGAGVATQAISGVVNAADLVAEFLGGRMGEEDHNFLAARVSLAGTSTLTFTRDVGTSLEVVVAGIVIELTGANWSVIEEFSHTFTAWNTTDTVTIASVTDWTTAFIVSSFMGVHDGPAELGCLIWPGTSATEVRLRTITDGVTANFGTATAFVVRNTQLSVDHYDTITGGQTGIGDVDPPPADQTIAISAVPDVAQAGLIMHATYDVNGFNGNPDDWFNYRLSAVDQINIWRSRSNAIWRTPASDHYHQWTAQVIDFSAMSGEDEDAEPEPPSEHGQRAVDRTFFFRGFRR